MDQSIQAIGAGPEKIGFVQNPPVDEQGDERRPIGEGHCRTPGIDPAEQKTNQQGQKRVGGGSRGDRVGRADQKTQVFGRKIRRIKFLNIIDPAYPVICAWEHIDKNPQLAENTTYFLDNFQVRPSKMWEQLGKIKNIKIVYNGGKYSYLISAADIYLAWFEENIRKNDLALNRQVHKIFHLYLKSERRFKKQKSLLEPEKMNNHMDYFAGILRKSYSLGLLVSGSFAIEHYLPFSLQSKTHDDLDFIVPRSDFLSNSEILLDQMRSFFPDLSRFVDLEKPQHRRKVFEADAMIDRKRQVVHVEFTDINVKSTPAQLNSRALKTKVCVLMPEMDYLVARLLVGAASVTRPWHRKLDDAAYLLSLFHFSKIHSRLSRRLLA